MPSQPTVSKAAVPILLCAGLLTGCTPTQKPETIKSGNAMRTSPDSPSATQLSATTQAAPVDAVIASVGTTKIKQSELVQPLMEAYGFNLLMLIVQRDMARDACREQNIVVTPAELKKEYTWTLEQMFPNLQAGDDRDKLLDQFLAQPKPRDQMSTRTELDIIVDTNAHLRKLVTPTINKSVTDEMLQQQFDEEYGAQVQARVIMVANPQEAQKVRQQLDGGADFAALARQVSRDPNTKRLGGELAPFTLNSTRLPANFKQVAFALKPGEVSDPVQASGAYYLIKAEKRIPPKAVKFEDVKDALREDYQTKKVLEAMKGLRDRLAMQALAQLSITEPTLKSEYDKRLAARDQLIRDRQKMQEQMEKDRQKAAEPVAGPVKPATAPATAPATNPAKPAEAAPAVKTTTEPAPPAPATGQTPTATQPVAPPAAAPTSAPAPAKVPAAAVPAPAPAVERAVPPATKPATAPATRRS
jgi:hypothetical protein